MKTKSETLNDIILLLEVRQEGEFQDLKMQFDITYESLKPINLVKSTLQEVTQSQEIKGRLLRTSIGILLGFISKKILVGKSDGMTKNLLGNIIQFSITNAFTSKGLSRN